MLRDTLSALVGLVGLAGCGARDSLDVGAGGQSTGAALPPLCARYASMLNDAGAPACSSCIATLGSVSGPCESDFSGVVESSGACAAADACVGTCNGTVCGCLETCLATAPAECTGNFVTLYTCLLDACGATCGA